MNNDEKDKFNRYWKIGFKYLFLIYFTIITVRLVFLLVTDNTESMTMYSIMLGYSIGFFGSLIMSVLLAYKAVNSERDK